MPLFPTITAEQQALLDKLFPPAAREIAQLKNRLAATDYKTLKYVEGFISEEDYAPIKAERQSIRERINELEAVMAEGAKEDV